MASYIFYSLLTEARIYVYLINCASFLVFSQQHRNTIKKTIQITFKIKKKIIS